MPLPPVDILEPPLKPIPESNLTSNISSKPEQKEEVYKGAFDAPGAAPAPEDPSRYAREFEEDVEDYLVKFERACSNMSRALTEYQDTMDFIKDNYDMKLHPNEYGRMCKYMVDLCPAALEIMSSIADYGKGLASRYYKKYPDYWKNPKYEKLLIKGYTAQENILKILKPSKQLKLPISNAHSRYVSYAYDELDTHLVLIKGVKSDIPENGGNFYLGMTERNIENTMSGIMDRYGVLDENIKIYELNTSNLRWYETPLIICEAKYKRENARRDLEKSGNNITRPNKIIVEELEAIQKTLKEVKWYNYRLEPHKRGKQYKIASDNSYDKPSKTDTFFYKGAKSKKRAASMEKECQDLVDNTNRSINYGFKIPLVATEHFEDELEYHFRDNIEKMLKGCKGRYMIVGELRNFRLMKGDGKRANDPTNINYNTDHKIIKPKTFRGGTAKVNTNHPCKWGIVAEVYVYPQYKHYIDSMNIFQCSYTVVDSTIFNVAIVEQGASNVDVIYDVEDFFKADNNHQSEKEEYERDVANALRDERAGNSTARSEEIINDADRMLNNLGYFRDGAGKPRWREKLEDAFHFPSNILNEKKFERLNLLTLMLENYVSLNPYIKNLIIDAFNFIEKIANRYYWYLPKLGEPGYVGDTKESLEKTTDDLLEKMNNLVKALD